MTDRPKRRHSRSTETRQLCAFIGLRCTDAQRQTIAQAADAAGWTRRGQGGGVVVVCLLDRERVWPDMLDCDRYEPRDGADAVPSEASA